MKAIKKKSEKQYEKVSAALVMAAREGKKQEVIKLISNGANLDFQGNSGRTPLMEAIYFGHKEIAKELIMAGASLDTQDDFLGKTLLMHVATSGNKEIVVELIKAGAKLDIQDNYGNTALILASDVGQKEIVAELISSGANLDIQNENGDTALKLAKYHRYKEIAKELTKVEPENDKIKTEKLINKMNEFANKDLNNREVKGLNFNI